MNKRMLFCFNWKKKATNPDAKTPFIHLTNDCSICTKPIESSIDMSITTCGHVYHTNCLLGYVMKKRITSNQHLILSLDCPLCRTTLLSE